jgi:hypothetical protein
MLKGKKKRSFHMNYCITMTALESVVIWVFPYH